MGLISRMTGVVIVLLTITTANVSSMVLQLLLLSSFPGTFAIISLFLSEFASFFLIGLVETFSHDLMLLFAVACLVELLGNKKNGERIFPSFCPISGGSGAGEEGILSLVPMVLKLSREIV